MVSKTNIMGAVDCLLGYDGGDKSVRNAAYADFVRAVFSQRWQYVFGYSSISKEYVKSIKADTDG